MKSGICKCACASAHTHACACVDFYVFASFPLEEMKEIPPPNELVILQVLDLYQKLVEHMGQDEGKGGENHEDRDNRNFSRLHTA